MLTGEDEQWHCYVCNPRPLSAVIEDCKHVFDTIEKEEKRAEAQEKREKGKVSSKTADASNRSVTAELFSDLADKFVVTTENINEVIDNLSIATKNLSSLLRTIKSSIHDAEEVQNRDINEGHSSRRETKDDLMLRIVKTSCAEMLNKGVSKFMQSVDSCKRSNQKSSQLPSSPRSQRLSSKKVSLSNKFKDLKASIKKKTAKEAEAEVISVSDSSEEELRHGGAGSSSKKARRKLSYEMTRSSSKKKLSRSEETSDTEASLRNKSSKGQRKMSESEGEVVPESKKSRQESSSKTRRKKSSSESEDEDIAEVPKSKEQNSKGQGKKSSSKDEEVLSDSGDKATKGNTKPLKKPDSSMLNESEIMDVENGEKNDVEEGTKGKVTKKTDLSGNDPNSLESMEVEASGSGDKLMEISMNKDVLNDNEVNCSVNDLNDDENVQVTSSKQDTADELGDEEMKPGGAGLHITPRKVRKPSGDGSKPMSPNTENNIAYFKLLKEMADGISEEDDDDSDEDDDSDVSSPRMKRRKSSKSKKNAGVCRQRSNDLWPCFLRSSLPHQLICVD